MVRKHLLISIPEVTPAATPDAATPAAEAALAAGVREDAGSPLPVISRKLGFLRSQTLDAGRLSVPGSGPGTPFSSTPIGSASPFNGSSRGSSPSPLSLQSSLSSPSCQSQTPAANQATIREQVIKTRNGLRTLRNLKFFQDMEPGVQQKLAKIVQHVSYQESTVIFRQNDPPGSCYIILSGEIGIFQKSGEDAKEDAKHLSKDDDDHGGCVIAHVKRKNNRNSIRRVSSLGDLLPLL